MIVLASGFDFESNAGGYEKFVLTKLLQLNGRVRSNNHPSLPDFVVIAKDR